MSVKTCFKCNTEKPIDEFHKHPRMRDGRLNKCSACTVADVRAWRKIQDGGTLGDRQRRYARELETGKRFRLRAQKEIVRAPPEVRKQRRRVVSAKHCQKRRAACSKLSRFDDFVMVETIKICRLMENETGEAWHLDHIVPLNHPAACGLHNAFNVQPVPAKWNLRKNNTSMDVYGPSIHYMKEIFDKAKNADHL